MGYFKKVQNKILENWTENLELSRGIREIPETMMYEDIYVDVDIDRGVGTGGVINEEDDAEFT